MKCSVSKEDSCVGMLQVLTVITRDRQHVAGKMLGVKRNDGYNRTRGVWNYMYVLYKANTGPTFLTTRVLVPKQCTLCCVRRYDVVSQGWFSAASQDNLISLGTKLRVGKRGRCDLRLQVERRERLWLQLRDGAMACAGRTTGYTSRPLRVPVLVHTQNMTAALCCRRCAGRAQAGHNATGA